MHRDHPLPDHLLDNPQLAIVALLDDALHLACHAIVASHTELMTGNGFEDDPPDSAPAWIAQDALQLMAALSDVLGNYCLSLRPPRRPPHSPADNDF
ncbi:MAG TPA: hypothetical protein VIW26_07525 [Gemmatimonadales bacterium]|jgi:hypothetical protein